MSSRPGYADVPLFQFMRDARDVYRGAVQQALESAGCNDIPRNGTFALAGLDRSTSDPAFSPQADVVASMGLSKQMGSQLIDTLVVRNYLERRNDPLDRRRMEVRLTARGLSAARAIREAIDAVETTVADLISAKELDGLRAGLAAYGAMRGRSGTDAGESSTRPAPTTGGRPG
jgi:DNA-binding MarR family transcriptional regulator